MAMDQFLAELYGTNKTASAQPAASAAPQHTDEDLAKQASIDLFIKVAADQSIDLKNMPADQVNALYGQFVEQMKQAEAAAAAPADKTAGEMPPQFAKKDKDDKGEGDGDKDDKGDKPNPFEAAKKEHEEKKAAAEKLAEADFLGRTMAHAMVQELGKIAEAREAQEKAAAAAAQPNVAAQVQSKVASQESNFDLVAGRHAIDMAKEAGFDVEQATRKVAAVLELGLKDSVKTASAPFEQAVGIRALEILEAAGYPVTWNDK